MSVLWAGTYASLCANYPQRGEIPPILSYKYRSINKQQILSNKQQILSLSINPNSWKIAYYYSHAEPFPYKFYLYRAKTGNTRIETDIFDFANYSFLKKKK